MDPMASPTLYTDSMNALVVPVMGSQRRFSMFISLVLYLCQISFEHRQGGYWGERRIGNVLHLQRRGLDLLVVD